MLFKRHHNTTAAAISQLDMKINKGIYYWDFLAIFVVISVLKFSDLIICNISIYIHVVGRK